MFAPGWITLINGVISDAGRKLLQTTSAQGVQTSSSSIRTQDGVYGSGPYYYG